MSAQKNGRPPGKGGGPHDNNPTLTREVHSLNGQPLYFWGGLKPLHLLSERWQRAIWELYDLGFAAGTVDGYWRGHRAGYAAAEEEMADLQRQAVAVNKAGANQPDFARLSELRGEPHRAEAHRRLIQERGVTPWAVN